MAPNVTVSFFDPADINGTPLLTITDEDTYFKGLKLQPDLYGVGGWELTLARAWGFALLGSEAMQSEVFVRFLVHAYSDTDYFYGGVLNKKDLTVVDRNEIGAEELVIGGSGPKAYLERYLAGIEQLTGTGFNIDLANGVWRWNENATAGRILNRFVAEDLAHSSPATPDLTRSFNDTHDSDGVAWVDDIAGPNDWETPIGSSLLQIIWDLEDLSDTLITTIDLGTVASPLYQLDAWQAYGEDVTGTSPGTGVCRIAEGLNIANESLTVQGVAFRKATHVIVEGKDGVWVVEVKPSFSPGDYKKLAKIEYPRSSSEAILHKAGLRWLRRQDNGDSQYTVELVPGADEAAGYYFPGPGNVLWVGNTVTLDTTADGSVHSPLDYNNADVLVTGIELELGPAGDDSTADAAAKSWDLTVKLNHERAGFGGSPSQSSPGTDGGTGGGCKCPSLCHPTVEGEGNSVEKTYNGNVFIEGGDSLNWDGTNAGDGTPPTGADGTLTDYFKSNAPDNYQETWAAAAGSTYMVTGYISCVSGGLMVLAFTNLAPGTDGGGINPGTDITAEHILTPPQPHHDHYPYHWTAFSAGPFTAPVGTTSAALGRAELDSAQITFDQVRIILVGEEGENPYNGTAAGAARCDHVHPASEIVVTPAGTVTSENVQDALEELAEDYQAAIDDAVAAIATGGGTFLSQFDDGFIGRRFLIGAHGGDIGNNGDTGDSWPQGSLQAHRQAALKGADYSDVDCRLTSDGVWVSYHDASITAGTNGTGNVDAITAATFTASEFDSTSIPGYNTSRHGSSVSLVTVQDIMDAVRPYGMSLQLELKPTDEDAATSLAELVVENHYEDRCYIHCNNDAQSAAVKVVSSRILVGRNYPDLPDTNADIFSIAYTSATSLAVVTAEAPLLPSSNMPIGEYGDSEDTIMQNMYDRGIRLWTSNDLDSALGFANGLVAGLGQVIVTDPQEGDMLRYTGGQWVNTSGRWEPVTAGAGIFVFDGDDIVMGWTDI